MSFPRKTVELIQNIDHHWFSTFDNITKFSVWQSDLICRAVTGEGFSKRCLHTDDEDFIYSFKRMIGLNGINNVAEKPDLLDRSVLFRLPAIPLSKRMDEEELWKKFDELAPSLMGALFDVLSKAMQIRSSVSINGSYLMADFTKWGCAIAQALGYSQSDFLDEYHRNLTQQNIEALEIDPVGVVFEHFWESYRAAGKTPIRLPPAQVYDEMAKIAESISITPSGKGWPKNPQVMGRRLGQLRANLRQQGIEFTSEREDRTRYWVFLEVDPSEYCVKCVIPSEGIKDTVDSSPDHDRIMTESVDVVNRVMENDCLDAEECSHDAMTEFDGQSQPTQVLVPETIFILLAQKPWTEGELRDKVVSLGFSRDSFDALFPVVRLDPRVQSHGVTPVYYSIQMRSSLQLTE